MMTPTTALSRRQAGFRGFTIIELMTVVVVMGTLVTLGYSRSKYIIDQGKVAKAIGDIRALSVDVQGYAVASPSQALPLTLTDIDRQGLLDPWGRPYVYVNLKLGGSPRTDAFGVNLNAEYDVYSLGPDGASALSLTAGPSQDDVVLGGDGGFIGRASRY